MQNTKPSPPETEKCNFAQTLLVLKEICLKITNDVKFRFLRILCLLDKPNRVTNKVISLVPESNDGGQKVSTTKKLAFNDG